MIGNVVLCVTYVTLKDADVSAWTVRECVEFLQVLTAV